MLQIQIKERKQTMSQELEKNIAQIKKLFQENDDAENKYLAIIELGRNLPPLDPELKTAKNKVEGCQSTTYLYSFLENSLINFMGESDALISSGLVAILIMAYNRLPPEIIVNNPPIFLNELGINASLSPNRANGLAQMYLRMKEDALKFLEK